MKRNLVLIVWIFIGIVFLGLLFYDRNKREKRISNAEFVNGLITGESKVAKGEEYVDYKFQVGGKVYTGSVSVKFCNECKNECCTIGSIVKVRYEKANPLNNDLLH